MIMTGSGRVCAVGMSTLSVWWWVVGIDQSPRAGISTRTCMERGLAGNELTSYMPVGRTPACSRLNGLHNNTQALT